MNVAPVSPRLCATEVEALDMAERPPMREALSNAAELIRIVAHGPDPAPEDEIEAEADAGVAP